MSGEDKPVTPLDYNEKIVCLECTVVQLQSQLQAPKFSILKIIDFNAILALIKSSLSIDIPIFTDSLQKREGQLS